MGNSVPTFWQQRSWVAREPHGTLVVVCYVLHARLVVTLQPLAELGHVAVLVFRQVQAGP